MDYIFACEKNGRKNFNYRHWRWQPYHCEIPRFNGKTFLEKIRGKKVLFVGDSLNRNQWVSLLCLIESSLPPSSHKSLTLKGNCNFFHSIEYNTTIGFYWSPFLVESNCDDYSSHRNMHHRVVKIEDIETHARHWNDADILIFDSYVWWLNPVTLLWGSFESPDATYKKLEMDMNLRPYEMGLRTWSDWLEMNINRTKTKLFFMS
ncbi:protein trichome birefringence-like 34, partial [Phtheirospermum japonicum]